jgi:beta-galactosidase
MTDLVTLSRRVRLDGGWRFGGSISRPGTEDRLLPRVVAEWSRVGLDDSNWEEVTVPHTVVPLSWELWDSSTWEKVWVYRRTLTLERRPDERVFIEFGAAMTAATVSLNGTVVGTHVGGYLPFEWEITQEAVEGDNQLTVILDSRFNINVPPNITTAAPSSSVDYAQPGGLHRDVWLRFEPKAFVADIALSNENVMDSSSRKTTAVVSIDSTSGQAGTRVTVSLADAHGSVMSTATQTVDVVDGTTEVSLELENLEAVVLWDVDSPTLYTVTATLEVDGETVHTAQRRTGYREARFELDGFYLNGRRRYLLGVNRHGYFPFAAFAMPERVQRRDVEIIRNELNCLMVRCAHYPHTESFLDACDELGLLVWEESPGWQHVGDTVWQERAVAEIEQMIRRDRHRPSIVIWGARLNETGDRPELYARTEALVKKLDPTRATSGTMHGPYARDSVFQHDVFSYDDYETRLDDRGRRRPDLQPPVEDRPYLIAETVSARSSPTTFYRRWEHPRIQEHQALDYANMHNDAMGDERYVGALAWSAFDYHTVANNHYRHVKFSGLGDVFRVLKPGAAIYRAQVDPALRAVIEPAFSWETAYGLERRDDGRPDLAPWDPGEEAMICSNCDRLEVYLDDARVAVAYPDREQFPHLPYAPTFVDLAVGTAVPELRIDGFVGEEMVLSRRFSADRNMDSLLLRADDDAIVADGVDSTRVTIAIVDRFGNPRTSHGNQVQLSVTGPGTLVGDQTIDLGQSGAVAAVWVRSVANETGAIAVRGNIPGKMLDTALLASVAPEPDSPRSRRG